MFFDTTTVNFQGEGPEGLAEHGYSRSTRSDPRQIVVAVVMTTGDVPIAHEVFPRLHLGSAGIPRGDRWGKETVPAGESGCCFQPGYGFGRKLRPTSGAWAVWAQSPHQQDQARMGSVLPSGAKEVQCQHVL